MYNLLGMQRVLLSVLNGEIQLIYISPESVLLNHRYRNMFLSGEIESLYC